MNKPFRTSRFIGRFLAKHWVLTLLLALAILGAATTGLLPPFTLRYLIDQYINPAISQQTVLETGKLAGFSILYFASYLLVGLFNVFENYMIDVFGQKLIHALRNEMIDKSHRLRSSYFTRHGTGEMTSRVTDDVYAIELLFADGLVSMLVSLFKILGILVSVFVFSWVLGLILLGLIPLIFLVTRAFQKRMLRNQLANRKILNQESNNLSESIDNSVTIKNLGKEGYREGEFHALLDEGYKVEDRTGWFDSVYSPVIEMIKTLVIALITFLVAYSMDSANGIVGLSIGTFAASLTLISNVFSPIQDIGQELQSMQEGISGIKRVEAFMNEPEVCEKDPSLKAETVLQKKTEALLVFDSLSFHYDDGEELIYDGMNLTVKPYDKISLIGRTGVGKTTLFRLILGILEPTSGRITVHGVDVSRIPDSEKRKIFGYVEQGFKPIPGTVMDQITLKDQSLTLDQVRKAMKDSFLDDYVMNHIPGGYEAPFKEEDFSRGQLQLLGLARAMVTDPELLLLDEISANLDSQTEKEVIDALAHASSSRTVISISHRLSDQLGFTRIIEVENGKAIDR
jgi:ATP-binding cassette subfamily B multidrug efflux pump